MISGPSSDNQKSEPPRKTDWLHQNSNWDPRKTEFLRKHSEFYRVDLEECIGGFYCPAEWNGHIGSRNQFLEPRNIFFHNSWSKGRPQSQKVTFGVSC